MSRIFGPVRQNGYAVRDVEAAMRHWVSLGVGPWFYFENVPVTDWEHRGRPGQVAMSIALANSGDLQLELIQQRNDSPSLYWEFIKAHGEGLQHVSAWTTNMAADLVRLATLGFPIIQQRNDSSSLYWEFIKAHGEGLQHVSAWTTNMAADLVRLATLGFPIIQQGLIGRNRFVYFDTEGGHPSTTMELYDIAGRPGPFFEEIREAARTWNGADPVRRAG